MNPLTYIADAYKRWRHSHGFGVHSPFAYDLVKTVVSPGNYAYYGYHDIDRMLLTPGADMANHLRHDARLLLRLLVFLQTKRLLVYPSPQPIMECAAKSAGAKCYPLTNDSLAKASYNTLILLNTTPPTDNVIDILKTGAAVLAIDSSPLLREGIVSTMTDGLILEGHRITIAVPRPDMVLTTYSIRF